MLNTRVRALLDIPHPIVLGGMAGHTNAELVAAVSNAGGLGILGCYGRTPEDIAQTVAAIRQRTDRPFGLNLLVFLADEPAIAATLDARPAVLSTAWQRPEQDLRALFARAHAVGALVMHSVSTLQEAQIAVDAGADILVAQGTEGGGHVGLIATSVLVPQVARAVPSTPVLAAGGIADGAGLAAALLLGADGAMLGTRFLATREAPIPESFKRALLASDGANTLLTEIPDIATSRVWPGAYARVARNHLVEDWIGREGELRRRRTEILERTRQARANDDASYGILYTGQSAGLVEEIEPAAEVVARIIREAEETLRQRARSLLAEE